MIACNSRVSMYYISHLCLPMWSPSGLQQFSGEKAYCLILHFHKGIWAVWWLSWSRPYFFLQERSNMHSSRRLLADYLKESVMSKHCLFHFAFFFGEAYLCLDKIIIIMIIIIVIIIIINYNMAAYKDSCSKLNGITVEGSHRIRKWFWQVSTYTDAIRWCWSYLGKHDNVESA